jgi:hypothetical protein
MFKCGLHAAMLATTHGTHVHEWRVLVIEKLPPVYRESFGGILWEPLPAMDSLNLAQL